MENENKQYFRNLPDGKLITVTEYNTKITYTVSHQRHFGNFVIAYERILIRKTLKARSRYFMRNNRVARAKRATVLFIGTTIPRYFQRKLYRRGISIYTLQ
jgi:hypothetical protein